MAPATPIEILAAWASGLQPSAIPPEQHRLVRRRLIDTLGLIAAAAAEPVGRALRDWARAYAGAVSATLLLDGTRAAPAVAALVHGTLAHARDFDDTLPDSVVHPGSVVVPAALSVAEQVEADFAELSSAIVLGYELAARLGKAAGRALHARGFHATGIVGPIAAAAAAGRLLRLEPGTMADALGLATSMSGGLLAFLADGAWSKWLHAGWSAHGGIVAAELAQRGFRGPRHAVDHASGLYGAFAGAAAPDLAALTDGLGSVWFGAAAQAKGYPCAHAIHPYLDAALALRRDGRLRSDEIDSIRCTLAPWAVAIVASPHASKIAPRSDVEAIASLPFMLAAALRDGKVDLDTLRPQTLAREDIRQLAARIDCDTDPTLGNAFDGYLAVHPKAGAPWRAPVALTAPDAEQIRRKFRANAAQCYDGDALAALETALLECEPRAAEIVRLACHAPRARHA